MAVNGAPPHATTISASEERRLLLKLDVWILPTLSLVFLWSFIDKTNLGNAKIFGLTEDLNLTGTEFNTSLVIYFVAYCFFDVPATLVIRKVKPHIYLSACMCVYGLITLSQGFVKSYSGLLAVRFFLGIAEAASFSCSFYLIAQWYRRTEAQKRFTFFYCTVQLGGAFSGLIAYGIGNISDLRGIAPWSWIFIVEGACTAGLAIPIFFILPDFPEQSTWLSPEEKQILLHRLEEDRKEIGGHETPLTTRRVFEVISQPKILVAGFYYCVSVIPAYAYSFFAPTIIHTYTTGAVHTQLISVPPWACGFVAALSLAALSDRLRHRTTFAIAPMCLAVAGYGVLLRVHGEEHAQTQYAVLFLVVLGIWTALPIIICWTTMNVEQPADRAVAMGWIIGFGNIGGMPAAYLYREDQAPNYTQGFAVSLSLVVITMAFGLLYATICWRENRKNLQRPGTEHPSETTVSKAEKATGVSTISSPDRLVLLNMM